METKSWWQSRAVWGGLIALLGGLGPLLGVVLDAETQRTLIDNLTNVAVAVGGLLALVGRLRANTAIASRKGGEAGAQNTVDSRREHAGMTAPAADGQTSAPDAGEGLQPARTPEGSS